MSQEVLTFRAVVELGNQWTAIAALISAKAVDNHPKNRFYGGVRRVQRALGVSADDATKLLADWARACAPASATSWCNRDWTAPASVPI
jgi:hypothetical protein